MKATTTTLLCCLFFFNAPAIGFQLLPAQESGVQWKVSKSHPTGLLNLTLNPLSFRFVAEQSNISVSQSTHEASVGITAVVQVDDISPHCKAYLAHWHVGEIAGGAVGAFLEILGPERNINLSILNLDTSEILAERKYENIVGERLFLGVGAIKKSVYYFIEGYGLMEYQLPESVQPVQQSDTGFGASARPVPGSVITRFSAISHVLP